MARKVLLGRLGAHSLERFHSKSETDRPDGRFFRPAGPATPVTATAIVALEWAKAPTAISRATGSLTIPHRLSVSGCTPSISIFASGV